MEYKTVKLQLGIFTSGFFFGLGLAIAGMTQPSKVLNFLDLAALATGTWDATLLAVLGGAVVTTFIGYRLVWRNAAPLYDTKFYLPQSQKIDAPLVLGAALFGLGWGLAGYCPGPALANLVTLSSKGAVFVLFMFLGMAVAKKINQAISIQHTKNRKA